MRSSIKDIVKGIKDIVKDIVAIHVYTFFMTKYIAIKFEPMNFRERVKFTETWIPDTWM